MDLLFTPIFANALDYAFKQATLEGKITIGMLVIVSFLSWTVMINKGRQLWRASRQTKKFYAAYREVRDPLEVFRAKRKFSGAPAYEVYETGVEELEYQLEHNAVLIGGKRKISIAAYESIMVAQERAVSAEALSLEKGMIILSTAVAGGPFIGLLGTVWGVMETFSSIGSKGSADLMAMAPGVAGALIATVVGLFVAIPAMFAYNYMITSIRHITQEVDNFNSELSTNIEHAYVDNRPLSEEIRDALMEAGFAMPAPKTVKADPLMVPAVA